ncbi:MAG: nucleotide sugar dehydrogenase [Thermofilaceae archaeon]|nr:nucleotide sugar dehydrogenase [Thermofilaceae archaeon]
MSGNGRMERVAVYGLGYVGKAVAAVFLRAGFHVVGVDVSSSKIMELNSGVVKYAEEEVREAINKGLREGRFKATADGVEASRECGVKIVTVPVHLKSSGEPDFSSLASAVEAVGFGAEEGDLVVVESSVPPGTTLNVVKPKLEEASGLRVEEEVLLAYSPERVYVGRAVKDIEERYPKVVAGVGPKSAEAAALLYGKLARRGVLLMSSPTAAELEKLFEGVYRDVNIALANELAMLASAMGVDYAEVREAANSQPFCHLHAPGVGVGGYCIPVYPRFVLYSASRMGLKLPLTELARRVNLSMPGFTSDLVETVVERMGVVEPKVAVLGLAFRGGVDDTRFSPTYDLVDHLLKKGFEDLIVHDPYVERDVKLEELGVKLTGDLGEALEGRDVVVLATDHPEYAQLTLQELLNLSGGSRLGVVDGRLLIRDWRNPPFGVVYAAVGRPLVARL